MKVINAINYFGGKSKLARALNKTPSCVSRWIERDENLPVQVALELDKLTSERLKFDKRDYQ